MRGFGMKTILCLLAGEMDPQNEEAIMKYDDDETMIHLLTHMVENQITVGMILSLYEQLGIGTYGETEIWLISDMPVLLQCASKLYAGLFDQYIKCPCLTTIPEHIDPTYISVSQCDKENHKTLLYLISKFQIVKQFTKTEEYYQQEKMLLKMQNDLIIIFDECEALYKKADLNTRSVFERFAEDYAYSEHGMVFRILCLSFLLQMSFDPLYAKKLYEETREQEFTVDQKLFLSNQIKRISLMHPETAGNQYAVKLFDEVVLDWKEKLTEYLQPITYDHRNKDHILILTLQFLGTRHAPTKTANERIYTIGKLLGKEVLCINTREQYTIKGFLPFYNATLRSMVDDYNGECRLQHKDFSFAYYQPDVEMPDEKVIINLLQEIREMAPWQVVVLGDKCLLGDLCAEMIPTVCIPMAFSTIPKKIGRQYVAVGKQLCDREREELIRSGYQMPSIIESTFTFELIEQDTKLSRAELNLPEDKFLLIVVRMRLDTEVTPEFNKMLAQTYQYGTHIVFAGEFETYEQRCNQDADLKLHSTFVGYQKDILALMEICDLYVNPPRIGGGFSVVEAFYKEIPGVTLRYGDVAASAGLDFCVDDLEEMRQIIIRYITDHNFYHVMSKKALQRSNELFDSKGAMEHILNEMEQRELWF